MKTAKAIFSFSGGIHPEYRKELSRDAAVRNITMPKTLVVSTAQHIGAPSKPIVKKGDAVLKGQLIAEPAGFVSSAVHAPASGKITGIEDAPTPIGAMAPAIIIEPDGQDVWDAAIAPCTDWQARSGKDLVAMVASAGIVGMGGAGFPTHVKLSPPPEKKIDTLIINGAECEPYLTADYRLMLEQPGKVWEGCTIIRHILGAQKVRIAIEDNKPEAIAAMEKAMKNAEGDVEIAILKTEYPQGAEKQQIYSITGREVPSGGLPMDVGTVVENVATCAAIRDAVIAGRPLLERITTVTGTCVKMPANLLAPIGTLYSTLIDECGGLSGVPGKIISGGPMMGLAQPSLATPTTKTTSGILILPAELTCEYRSMPCISCGRCVRACPMNLLPSELSQMLEAEDFEMARDLNVMDCIECGCCAYECPAHRPLVQHMKQGKAWVMRKRREEQAGKAQK